VSLRRVLVANRGEIAVRIVRACFDEGVESVAAVSDADRDSLAARRADTVVRIGPAAASASYLDVGAIVGAAIATGCDAVHPGYGFLSERPELAAECARVGLTFVGPPADVIRRGGSKIGARALARSIGVPVGEGSDRAATPDDAAAAAARIGYPVLLKASAGGGGRGMVRVDSPAGLCAAFTSASREAEAAFGDGTLFVERWIGNARHVEVQILADTHGAVIHLGERDCSAQRRFQKIVEEAPASALPESLRADICAAATLRATALEYVGAGTVEFLVDVDRGDFSFLEVNTRVQVEHPVTEMITGVDIVREQLRIAACRPLSITQDEVRLTGHAIECRLNAEDAAAGFLPTPGRIERWTMPEGAGVRVDTHCFDGWTVVPHYDSMIAKLICWGGDRPEALRRMDRALAHVAVDGVSTTAGIARDLVRHGDFRANRINTRWIEDRFLPQWRTNRGEDHGVQVG
jgi:acetyl-CoA carboxylase, biotin carboxylase subunit